MPSDATISRGAAASLRRMLTSPGSFRRLLVPIVFLVSLCSEWLATLVISRIRLEALAVARRSGLVAIVFDPCTSGDQDQMGDRNDREENDWMVHASPQLLVMRRGSTPASRPNSRGESTRNQGDAQTGREPRFGPSCRRCVAVQRKSTTSGRIAVRPLRREIGHPAERSWQGEAKGSTSPTVDASLSASSPQQSMTYEASDPSASVISKGASVCP